MNPFFPFLIVLLFLAPACSPGVSSSTEGLSPAPQVSPSITPKPRKLDAMFYGCREFSIELHSDGRWTKFVGGSETSIQSGKTEPEVVEPLLVLAEKCDRYETMEIKRPVTDGLYFREPEPDTTKQPFLNGGHLLLTSSPDGNRYLRGSKWMNLGLRLKLETLALVEPQPAPGASRLISHVPLEQSGKGPMGNRGLDFSLDSSGVFREITRLGKRRPQTCFRLGQAETERIFAGIRAEAKANRPPKSYCRCCDIWLMEVPPYEFHDESGSHSIHRCWIDPLLSSLHQKKLKLFAPWIAKISYHGTDGSPILIAWEDEDVAPLFSELQQAWDLQTARAGPIQGFKGKPPDGSFYVSFLNPILSRGYYGIWIVEETNLELHALFTRLCSGRL